MVDIAQEKFAERATFRVPFFTRLERGRPPAPASDGNRARGNTPPIFPLLLPRVSFKRANKGISSRHNATV